MSAASERSVCPHCGAAAPAGSQWCTLCFADLRPAPLPMDAPVAAPLAAPVGSPVPTRPAAVIACPTCGVDMPVVADACPACGSSPFAGLSRVGKPSLQLPLIGDLMRFPSNARMLIALSASVVLAGIAVMVVALIGSLF